ncbi:Transient receptor putative cation channel subfamily M member 3 [Cichlidogyrus casuarinus]|uniref:Transient receptor putative cation channel subfamily M member 3 n=1 Tax=Cichlidogyrus casuarinus TaxID=1844966 RepID=A0ABD2QH87_9PLAT
MLFDVKAFDRAGRMREHVVDCRKHSRVGSKKQRRKKKKSMNKSMMNSSADDEAKAQPILIRVQRTSMDESHESVKISHKQLGKKKKVKKTKIVEENDAAPQTLNFEQESETKEAEEEQSPTKKSTRFLTSIARRASHFIQRKSVEEKDDVENKPTRNSVWFDSKKPSIASVYFNTGTSTYLTNAHIQNTASRRESRLASALMPFRHFSPGENTARSSFSMLRRPSTITTLNNPGRPLSGMLSTAAASTANLANAFGIGQSTPPNWSEPNMNNAFFDMGAAASAPNVHRKQLSYRKKVYEFFSAPVTRFYLHVILYVFFLVLYTGLCVHMVPQNKVSWLELYIYLHIVTYFMDKFREVTLNPGVTYYQQLKVHLQAFWNIYDIIMCSCSTIGIIIRYAGWYNLNTYMYGRNLLVLCCSLWLMRFLELMQIWRFSGPYIYMLVKMLRAMIPMLSLLLIPLIAFGTLREGIMCGFNRTSVDLDAFKGVLLKPYFMLYGEVYAGEIDPKEWKVTMPWYQAVPIAMVIYLLYSIILLISLIIAIFNDIFASVLAQSALVYKYLRYAVIIEYESRPLLPPPFIIISWFYSWIRFLIK